MFSHQGESFSERKEIQLTVVDCFSVLDIPALLLACMTLN